MNIKRFRQPSLACLTILSLQWTYIAPPALAMQRAQAESRGSVAPGELSPSPGVVESAPTARPGAAGPVSPTGATPEQDAPPAHRSNSGPAQLAVKPAPPPPPVLPHVSLATAVRQYNRHLDQTEELLALDGQRKGRQGLLEAKETEFRAAAELLEERFAHIRGVLLTQGRSEQLADFETFVRNFQNHDRELRSDLLAAAQATGPVDRNGAEKRITDRLKTRKDSRRPSILGAAPPRHRPRSEIIQFEARPPSLESTIVPAYRGGRIEKTAGDLDPTPEVQITPEIVELAARLDNSPLRIYEWVRNHTTFEPYFGSRKGSQAALETLAGNDYDLASLTIALLRASNIPARYVRGTVEIPTDRTLRWLGVRHPGAASSLLNNAGLSTTSIVAPDDTVVRFQIDRVWVEALVSHANYRGVEASTGSQVWVPLDPAFKLGLYQQGISGIGDQVVFDEDGYLATRTNLLAFEWYQNQVGEWLRTNLPGKTVGDVPYKGSIEAESLGVLPASLPHEAIAFTGEWAELPDNLRHRYQLTLFDQFDNPILDLPARPTAATSLSRITLSYDDAPASAGLVAALGGASETPAFLQTLTPLLKLDGVVAASGSTVSVGDPVTLRLRYSFPDDDPVKDYFHERMAGDYHALAMDLNQLSETLMERKAGILIDANAAAGTPGEDDDALTGELLSLAGMRYWQRVKQGDEAIAELFQYKSLKFVSEVLASANTNVLFLFDRPFAVSPGGVNVDAQRLSGVPVGIDEDQGRAGEVTRVQGRNSSAAEHAIWEEIVHVDSVSTIKALQFANETDVNGDGTPGLGDVLELVVPGQTSLLCPGFSPTAASSMEAALAVGKIVKTPYCDFVMNDWHGVGWIEQDTVSGVAGYLISGFLAGGATTRPVSLRPERWLPMGRRGFEALEDCARTAGVEVLLLENPRDVARLNVSAEVRKRIRAELESGRTVRAPAAAVSCMGVEHFGYLIDEGKGRAYQVLQLHGGSGTQLTWEELQNRRQNGTPDGSACSSQQSTGEPVTLSSGNMYHQFLDLEIPGLGPMLAFERTYNSQSTRIGSIGYGWSHTYDVFVTEEPGVSAMVTEGTGRETTFLAIGGGVFEAPAGVYETLETSGSGWTLTFDFGEIWTFDSAGRLESISDLFGNSVTLTYDGSGRLTAVTDALSRNLTLGYGSDGFLDSLADWTGRTWTYDHDGHGNLVSSSTPSDPNTPSYTTTYTYHDLPYLEHNLARIQFPEGYSIDFDYYANDKLFRHTESGLRTTQYLYQPLRLQTKRIDPRGKITHYTYDTNGRMSRIEDPDGSVRSFTYDSAANLIAMTDLAGYSWTQTYDNRGRLLTRVSPLLQSEILTYATAFPHPSTSTDREGNLTTYDVDPATGRVTRMVDAEDGVTLLTYDARGRLETVTDPRGAVQQFSYDPGNSRLASAVRNGLTITHTTDPLGRVLSITDPESNIVEYEYDVLDRIVRVSDALGEARLEYNGLGRRTRWINYDGTATSYADDQLAELMEVTDRLGRQTKFERSEPGCGCSTEGLLTRFVSPGGRAWSFAYDDLGRIAEATDPAGNTTRHAWDPRGLRIETTRADGLRVGYEYDADGRLVQIDPQGEPPLTYGYDADGRLISASNAVTTQSWERDGLGRVTRFEDSLTGKVVRYSYDAAGSRTQLIDGEGLTTTYDYDVVGRLTAIHDFDGQTFTVEQDNLSRTTSLGYPNTQTMTRDFDPRGNLLSLRAESDSTTAIDRTYAYDAESRALTEQDSVHGDSSYAYDAAGRLVRANRTGRPDETYAYDAADNRISDATGWSHAYDEADRLRRRGAVTYDYDPRGNLIRKSDPDGVTRFSYDWKNRMRSADLPDGTHVEFRYDPFGRRIEKIVDGVATRMLRDGSEILARYDGAGVLLTKYVRSGEAAIAVRTAGQKYFLHQDRRQSTVAVTDVAGDVVTRILYDGWGNIIESDGSWDDPIRYIGRDFDPELGLYDLQARHYDPVSGRFLQLDPLGPNGNSANLYAYAGNDPINNVDPTGTLTWAVTLLIAAAISALIFSGALDFVFEFIRTIESYSSEGEEVTPGLVEDTLSRVKEQAEELQKNKDIAKKVNEIRNKGGIQNQIQAHNLNQQRHPIFRYFCP